MESPDLQDAVRQARAAPKVLLHEHLDGGLRVGTLRTLLLARGLKPPAADDAGLAAWFDARAHAGSLEAYLEGFGLTVAAMASPEGLRRVAREAAEDAAAEGCVLAEFRVAPLLFEAHGVAGEAAVEALLQGLAEGPIPTGLILCAMRQQDEALAMRTAALAVRFRPQGVVGFDQAGPERGFPAHRLRAAVDHARAGGVGITLHAGEADSGLRVLEAAALGATRIGHGVRLADFLAGPDGEALRDAVRAHDLHLEVCPTSNVHTGAAASLAAHPIAALWRAGFSLSFHTDNRLMSRLTMADEAENLVRHCGLTPRDLAAMARQAAHRSFLPPAQREVALAAIDAADA
jgi:adenosine deaminase